MEKASFENHCCSKLTTVPQNPLGLAKGGEHELNLASPYFASAYTLTVASARDDVEVAVLKDAGQVVLPE
jgi:hypothetical protein